MLMWTYMFIDAEENGMWKPIRRRERYELEDREIEALLLRYNATRVQITPPTAG